MTSRLTTALLVALAAGAAPAWADPAPPVAISHIGAQLLYSNSGALSQDIAPPAKFSGWNTIIGEGDAGGAASDVLVTVTLTSPVTQLSVATPLLVSARSAAGKVLAQRKIGNILIDNGKTFEFVLLPDATCAGKVTITATLGQQSRTAALALDCGE
jgi:hypothetical protein